jgi:hypothetical protein
MTPAPPLTVPPFQAVSGSYRMRHLHASASSQETGDGADPIHLHAQRGGRTRMRVLGARHHRGRPGSQGRACPRHAVVALNGIIGAHVDWPDSKGLNE